MKNSDGLVRAGQGLVAVIEELRCVHSDGNAVESLILLPIIYRVADLLREINAVLSALSADDNSGS